MAVSIPAFSEKTISGKVVDVDGNPLPALVTIESADGVLGFCLAGADGTYSISFEPEGEDFIVKAALLGYDPVEKTGVADSGEVDFVLTEGSIELQEVTVVPDKITQRGDTLSYAVGAYKDAADRVIGDVIKKMPGLEVSESGQIAFNGKTVKNFYVEDMDLLEGRYGIATNNISANDVATVQVYQNHQPVRALKDWSPSDDVSINIKLKPSAKGTFTLNGMAGGGYKPWMWAAEAVGMYFGRKAQTITTYKGNNSGDNVRAEYSNHNGDGPMQFLNKAPLSVITPGAPGVAQKRYLQNRTNAMSSNSIFRTDSLSTLNISISYINDIVRKEGETVTQQYLPEGSYRGITQRITSRDHSNDLSGSISFKRNSSSLYLDNALHINAGWDKENASSLTAADFLARQTRVDQKLDNPSFSVDDRLNIISNNVQNKYEMMMEAGWNHRPQSLEVTPASIFSADGGDAGVSQTYDTDDFKAMAQTGFGFKPGNVKINAIVYGNVDVESVSSGLNDMPGMPTTENDYTFGKGEVAIEPRLSYLHGDLYIEAGLPVSYEGQWMRDRLDTSRDRSWHYIDYRPSLRLTWRLTKSWWGLTSNLHHIRDNSERVASGPVLTDYMTLREYLTDRTLSDRTWHSSAEYHYSNAMAQTFANATVFWLRSWKNVMSAYQYDGLLTIRDTYDIPYTTDIWSATANFSKGLRFLDSTLKLNGSFRQTSSRQIIDAQPVGYRSRYWSANLMYAVAPAPWFGGALAFAYGESRAYTEINRRDAPTSRQCTGRLDLNFFPIRTLVVNVSVEDNYTNMTAGSRHAWFGDLKLKYKMGSVDWELDFNNVFNRRTFTRVAYSNMDIYTSTYVLRPRNVMLKVRFKIL